MQVIGGDQLVKSFQSDKREVFVVFTVVDEFSARASGEVSEKTWQVACENPNFDSSLAGRFVRVFQKLNLVAPRVGINLCMAARNR